MILAIKKVSKLLSFSKQKLNSIEAKRVNLQRHGAEQKNVNNYVMTSFNQLLFCIENNLKNKLPK